MGQHQPHRPPRFRIRKAGQPSGHSLKAFSNQHLDHPRGRAQERKPSLALQVRIPCARRNREAAQDSRLWAPRKRSLVFQWRPLVGLKQDQKGPETCISNGDARHWLPSQVHVPDTGVPSPGALGKDAVGVLKEHGMVRRTGLIRQQLRGHRLRVLESAVGMKKWDGAGSRTPKVRPAWPHSLVALTPLQNVRNAVLLLEDLKNDFVDGPQRSSTHLVFLHSTEGPAKCPVTLSAYSGGCPCPCLGWTNRK